MVNPFTSSYKKTHATGLIGANFRLRHLEDTELDSHILING